MKHGTVLVLVLIASVISVLITSHALQNQESELCVLVGGTDKSHIYFNINDGQKYTQQECLEKFEKVVIKGSSLACQYSPERDRPPIAYRAATWGRVYEWKTLKDNSCSG